MPDIVIVGAGIAGLSAAWELTQRGLRPVVLEQSSRPGGVIVTERVNGFAIDGGPDSILTQKPAAIDLCRELGIADRLVSTESPRTAYVLRGGRLVPLPEGSFLGIPTHVRAFIATPLFSWRAKLRMAMEVVIPARHDEGDESIGSFIRRRFGQEAVTYIAEPLLAGIHAGDVDALSIQASFPRLRELERAHGSVLRGLSSLHGPSPGDGAFKSLPEGLEELVQTLACRLPVQTVRTDSQVTSVSGSGPYTVTTARGEHLEARSVILAAPAWAVAALIAGIDPEVSTLIARIRYASSATVAIALRREQIQHPLNGTGFVVPRLERRTLMAATWVSSKWPGRAPPDHALLRGFLGGTHDPEILSQGDEVLSRVAFEELASLLQISGKPLFTRVYRWPRASAQHEVGHLDRMAAIDRRLANYPGLYVTGSGFRGTGIPDCISDGRATARQAAAQL